MIRSAWVGLHLLLSTVPLSLVVIIGSYLGAGAAFFRKVPGFWARWLIWAAGARVEVQGRENIALDRPQIVAANHVSWYDVLALAAYVPKRYRFIAKQELARIPIFGHAWQAAGHIAIDRADTQRAVASLDRAGRMIREDNSAIVIFPEGTRSGDGRLQPFKKGAFMLALHNHIDIVPTAVLGTHRILPKNNWRVRSGRIIVRFGRPIRTTDYQQSDRDKLIARVRAEIEQLLALPATYNQENDVDHRQHPRS